MKREENAKRRPKAKPASPKSGLRYRPAETGEKIWVRRVTGGESIKGMKTWP